MRGWIASYIGEWAQAQQDLERALAAAEAVGGWAVQLPRCVSGTLHLMTGEWELAAHHLETNSAIMASLSATNHWFWSQRLLVELDLLRDRPAEARARLLPLFDQPDGDEHDYPILLWCLALACLQLGEVEEAEQAVARSIARARQEGGRQVLVDALRVQALVAIRQEAWDEAAQALVEGLQLARAMPFPYAEGRLLHVYGQVHAAQGAADLACARYQEALAIFRLLGARKDLERAEHQLAELARSSA
jgi:hypothetical protein